MPSKRILVAACLAILLAPCVFADEIAAKGRAILEANKSAVITVIGTIKISYGGKDRESEIEANGTVIAPTGVTVLSLTAVDPGSLYGAPRDGGPKPAVKVTALKMLLEDGAEVPAEIVLRDVELDLAFIRPIEAPATPMAHIGLDDPGHPELLDELAIIGQLGKVVRRAHCVLIERIEAVVEKPRTLYLIGEHRANAVACSPAFTLDGKFVGIGVLRTLRGKPGGAGSREVLTVIVAAEDIKESADQAPPYEESS